MFSDCRLAYFYPKFTFNEIHGLDKFNLWLILNMLLQNTYDPLLVCLVVVGRHYSVAVYMGEGLCLKNIKLSNSTTIYFLIAL